jgi:preprotein translocase subunit SecY
MRHISSSSSGVLGMYSLFTGGALENCAVGALGIMPYISATIVIQLLTAVVPSLSKLAREEGGRVKIIKYSRYLTVLICLGQGLLMTMGWENPQGMGFSGFQGKLVTYDSMIWYRIQTVLILTTGTLLLMWLGEQITERGIGNGISLVITIGILARLPAAARGLKDMFFPGGGAEAQFNFGHAIAMLLLLAFVVAGVMPIIFAQAILMVPQQIFSRIGGLYNVKFFREMGTALADGALLYLIIYTLMILFFSYFWTATQFNELQIADDLKKGGGYIPGVRPGQATANFLHNAMSRITLAGAVFLTVIAVIPIIMTRQMGIPYQVATFFGGTSMLIMVGVLLDTMRQMESHLLMRHYDGFLSGGRGGRSGPKLRGRL